MNKVEYLFLMKMAEMKYIIDMYENEYLYFNRYSTFRSSETDKTARLDPREGNIKNYQVKKLTIKISNLQIQLHKISSELNSQFTEFPNFIPYNICSLYFL
jgi:hypothetical protein